MSLTRLLAILSFFMAVIFYGWGITHDAWTWQLFMLLGLFFWCVHGSHDRVP